ncbi:hypothetical protein LPJ66_003994 [Kickxella alabastrina]|uniref:Uncharacterized protein n=1 Tax=Kickxella alabastrina TaxID=61397 RepID=A0ACC1IMB2_9FUNG|nr:hypothetical protein LPJ66_003994 [Kickxella alabastrina]
MSTTFDTIYSAHQGALSLSPAVTALQASLSYYAYSEPEAVQYNEYDCLALSTDTDFKQLLSQEFSQMMIIDPQYTISFADPMMMSLSPASLPLTPVITMPDSPLPFAFQEPPHFNLHTTIDTTSPATLDMSQAYIAQEATPQPSADMRHHYLSARITMNRERRNAVYVPRDMSEAAIAQVAAQAQAQEQTQHSPAIDSQFDEIMINFEADNKENICYSSVRRSNSPQKNITPKGYSNRINKLLYDWLEKHKEEPYPTTCEKQRLMSLTGLTKMQIKNWFCNIRRRKLENTIRRTKKSPRTALLKE